MIYITVLLLSCLLCHSNASFSKTKYNVNNSNVLDIREKLHGSNAISETQNPLSIEKSVILPDLNHGKTFKYASRTGTENIFHPNSYEKIKRGKREEKNISNVSTPVQNFSITLDENVKTTPAYSPEFLSCGKIPVQDYTKFENGTVYVPFFDIHFSPEHYIIDEKLQELLICKDFLLKYHVPDDLHESSRRLQIASLVCSCLSTAFLALFIVMFIVDKDMRTLPGSCVLSLCCAQIVAYSCTFVQYYIKDEFSCMIIGMSTFYFFLASFFWMNVMSFDIWRSVRRSIVELRLCTGRSIKRQLSIFSLYAWGTPLAITMASISVHLTTSDDRFRLIFYLSDCWFEHAEALWLYFTGPVLFLLVANFLFFAVVFYMLQRTSYSQMHSGFQGKMDLKSRFVLCLKLNSVMGLTWLLGIVAELSDQEWLRCLYVILSGLQGMFIFFSYIINTKTKRMARGFFNRHRQSFPNTLEQTKSTRL